MKVKKINGIEALIAVVGLVAAVLVFGGLRQAERAQARLEFEAKSSELSAAVEATITELRMSLSSFQEVNGLLGELDRNAFERLSRSSLKRHPALVELIYVPIVAQSARSTVEAAARRDGVEEFKIHDGSGKSVPVRHVYSPLLYIEPSPSPERFGLDLGAVEAYPREASEVTQSGNTVILSEGALPMIERADRRVSMMLAPIFDPDGVTFVSVGRRRAIRAHVLAVFDNERLMAQALDATAYGAMPWQLLVHSESGGRRLAGATRPPAGPVAIERRVRVPGQDWRIHAVATSEFMRARATWIPHASFVAVAILVTLLVGTFRQQRLQKAAVERQVDVRTAELTARTRDMRRVLDNVDTGLLTINIDGQMSPEASARVEAWFGPRGETQDVVSYIGRFDPLVAEYIALGLDQLKDDFLPMEVTLDQMPRRATNGSRTLDIAYLPFDDGEEGLKILVVMGDITEELASEYNRSLQSETIAVFRQIAHDKEGFLEFFHDATGLISGIAVGEYRDELVCRRALHTLKGNCGLFGIKSVARQCHVIEDRMAEEPGLPTASESDALVARWNALTDQLRMFVGDHEQAGIEISDREFYDVLRALLDGRPTDQVQTMIESWRNERVEPHLERLAARATSLAERLGKGRIEVQVDHGEVRLPRERFKVFWTNLAHIVRNAVDHGLETQEERTAAGKPGAPTVSFSSAIRGQELIIEVGDNGKGINWSQLEAKARRTGVPFHQREDLLFVDGLSVRDSVSSTSGRGVGLAAVQAAVRDIGGRVEIASELNQGTTFRFIFATSSMALPPIRGTSDLQSAIEARVSLRESQSSLPRVQL